MFLLCQSCSKEKDSTQVHSSNRTSSVATADLSTINSNLDLRDVIAKCETLPLTDFQHGVTDGRSIAERGIIATKIIPNGMHWEIESTLIAIHQELLETGRVVDNGMQLFPELATAAGLAAFEQMSATEKLNHYYYGINPLTGKFYESFGPEWNAGGLCFGPEVTERETRQAANGRELVVNYGDKDQFTEIYKYKVFGETAGAVLYEDMLAVGSETST
jgi:hypothetical protein